MTHGVHARALTKRFKGALALDQVDFDAPAGTLTTVVGGNGAGKTTLLKILATLLLPDGGSATVAGADLLTRPADVRRRIGVALVNERAMYWRLDATENLLFFGRASGLSRATAATEAERVVDLLGMNDFARKPVSALSAGQRQRVNLGRALMGDPPVLLIDEPFRGLDDDGAAAIASLLRGAAGEGRTVIVAGPSLPPLEPLTGIRLHQGHVSTQEPVA